MNLQMMKKKIKKLFFLPPVPTLLISIPSFVFVFYILAKGEEDSIMSYLAYFLSGYALIITITGIVELVKWIKKGIAEHPFIKKLLDIPMVERFLEEALFRTEVSLYSGLAVNLLYAGIKFFSGIYYKSVWFVTLSVYYILLAAMRFSLLNYIRKERRDGRNPISELKRSRLCGLFLLVLDMALAGIIILVLTENSGFEYPGTLIYAMALYAFGAVTTAVGNVVKYRKYGNAVISAVKVVSLTAALVSMLSLETAMLTQFGAANEPAFRQIMFGASGAGVSIIVLGMAVYMIVKTTKQLEKIKTEV